MMKWYFDQFNTAFMQGWGMTETNPGGTIAVQRSKFEHKGQRAPIRDSFVASYHMHT
jgi:hypothetical protein